MLNVQQHDVGSAQRHLSTRTRLAIMLTMTAMLGVGVLAAGMNARGAERSSAIVSLRTTKYGKVLVSRTGRTLYLFAKDTNGKSACTGACATYWPPLIVSGKPIAGPGVKASLLGTTTRSNGTRQVTYNGHPLYTFKLDTGAGQTNGEGNLAFGAKWWVVSAKGLAVKTASTTHGY